jgi:hypothetical protein
MEEDTILLLNTFNPNIEILNISNENIIGILNLNKFKKIKILNCSNNKITCIQNIPKTIINLDCSYNNITCINDNLEHFKYLIIII